MDKKIVSPTTIKREIFNEGLRIKRKQELHEAIVKIEEELKQINEASMGMAASFGFVGDKSENHKSGFVDDQFQNISNIARLEKEFSEADANSKEQINEVDELKKEIEELKKQLEESKTNK